MNVLISRDPFARQELHRETIDAMGDTCSWCGNVRKGNKLYVYYTERELNAAQSASETVRSTVHFAPRRSQRRQPRRPAMAMFDKAKTIAPATKKPADKKKTEIEIAGIEHLAMIDALQKTLDTVRSTLEAEVKTMAAERFTKHIHDTGQRPDNFTGIEGGAAASIQFRRKSSAYALTDETVALLRDSGIEPEKQIVTPQLFAINPAYASDDVLLGKVEKALTKIVPDDFIVTQAETSKLVATEETLNAAISKRAPAAVIQSLTTISCGLKLKNTDMAAILEFVGGLIDAPVFGKAAEQAHETKTKLRIVA